MWCRKFFHIKFWSFACILLISVNGFVCVGEFSSLLGKIHKKCKNSPPHTKLFTKMSPIQTKLQNLMRKILNTTCPIFINFSLWYVKINFKIIRLEILYPCNLLAEIANNLRNNYRKKSIKFTGRYFRNLSIIGMWP
jgi:hypothetical protein